MFNNDYLSTDVASATSMIVNNLRVYIMELTDFWGNLKVLPVYKLKQLQNIHCNIVFYLLSKYRTVRTWDIFTPLFSGSCPSPTTWKLIPYQRMRSETFTTITVYHYKFHAELMDNSFYLLSILVFNNTFLYKANYYDYEHS